MTPEEPRALGSGAGIPAPSLAKADRRAYVALQVLGAIALLLFGPIQCAVLRQDEGLGMVVAFLVVPLAIPFAIAFLCALVFSARALFDGSVTLRARLLVWYGLAALFALQIALLDGGPRTATVTAKTDVKLLGLTEWAEGRRTDVPLARGEPHGRWMQWLA